MLLCGYAKDEHVGKSPGRRNVESFFQELLAFARGLSEEEQRTAAENLSEEELAIFDIPHPAGPTVDP